MVDEGAPTRTVAENTKAGQAIGDPVVAEDKDGDVLTYTLGGTDAGVFAIDWATGQLKTKGRWTRMMSPSELHSHGSGDGPGGRTHGPRWRY